MQDTITYNQKDLILKVNNNYNPINLDLESWELFIEKISEGREYQKEAIKNAIIYLASGRYNSIEDLINENYLSNSELKKRYITIPS